MHDAGHSEKKEEPKRHHFCPLNRPLCGTILALFFREKNDSSLQKVAVFQNGSSEAPFWLHLFSEWRFRYGGTLI